VEDGEREEEWWKMVEEEQVERRKKKAAVGGGEEKGDDLGEEGKRITGEDAWRKFEERRERVRRERERREIERKERERGEEVEKRRERRRNVVWRCVEGGSAEERKRLMKGIVREELGRRVEIGEVRERRGSAGMVLIVKMEKVKDKIELLEWEIRRNWGWGWMRT